MPRPFQLIIISIVAACGTRADHSPDMVAIPEATFVMGCNRTAEGVVCDDPQTSDEAVHRVRMSSFMIDRLELSRDKYEACVTAGGCTSTGAKQTGSLPVAVTWEQAAAYCKWVGKRLPTEAEWEIAARGTDGRTFPWGNGAPTCKLAHYASCGGGYVSVEALPAGKSPYGALNMAGNISEWVDDLYDAAYYARSPASNPRGPATGDGRVVRGGNGISPPLELRTANRAYKARGNHALFGIRCAKDRN